MADEKLLGDLPRGREEREEELRTLGFVREAPTRWLDPGLLVRSGIQSIVSSAFGRFADRREMQAKVDQPVYEAHTDRDEMWLDFLADTGDGFAATMTMAWLLAQPDIEVDGTPLPRGDMLLLGGDLVYPAADRQAYENRFVGPFAGALPELTPQAPRMLAIPGNHDWYDGLVAFTRRFCQQRAVGGWQTLQKRSYAAIHLPHNWWVWMIDIQLDELVDDAQLTWFREVALPHMKEGDRVILVTGKPSWLRVTPDQPFPPAWENLNYVESIVREKGTVELVLTGDLHHYARYMPPDGSSAPPRITSGGGGAYLSPTHTLPKHVALPIERGDKSPLPYTRETEYPAKDVSAGLGKGVLKLGKLSPGLARVFAGIYAVLAFVFAATLQGSGEHIVVCAGLIALVVLALYTQLDAPPRPKLLVSIAQGIGHAVLCWAAVLAIALPLSSLRDDAWLEVVVLVLVMGLAAVVGYLGGTLLFAWTLWRVSTDLESAARETGNQVFAAQGIEDYKNWLRLHIDPTGALHVHALGVDEICREWTGPHPAPGPRFRPKSGTEPTAHQIDAVTRGRSDRIGSI